MAQKQVAATRMTLLSLKNQVKTANRGHKLLKDKQDGLMQEFLKIVRRAKDLRLEVESALSQANASFMEAQAVIPKTWITHALTRSNRQVDLNVKTKNVMSVKLPVFDFSVSGEGFGYNLHQTTGTLDVAVLKYQGVLDLLIQLAEIEKSCENLAIEIEKTRRRVNALEYTLIPELESNLKFVKMKLGEAERSAIVQVMAVKEMIEAQERAAEAA